MRISSSLHPALKQENQKTNNADERIGADLHISDITLNQLLPLLPHNVAVARITDSQYSSGTENENENGYLPSIADGTNQPTPFALQYSSISLVLF